MSALTSQAFDVVVERLRVAGWADEDIAWSETLGPPETAEKFAAEAIFVICNSGMRSPIATKIYRTIMPALAEGRRAGSVFGHVGKAEAIDTIWRQRDRLWREYLDASDKLAFCASLPFIGEITKYHLAKQCGADVAKPDRHLVRLAALGDESPQDLCERLGRAAGLRAATVDVLLWRACAEGVMDSRTGALRP